MVYAYAHDQTVENDYFAAMGRIEHRLELVDHPVSITIPVSAAERRQLLTLAEQLFVPEMTLETRLEIASQMRNLLSVLLDWIPPPILTNAEII